jgi:sensor histidine kinase YesM
MRRREDIVKRWRATFKEIVDSVTARQWSLVCKIWASIALMLIVYNMTNYFLSYGLKDFSTTYLCRQTLPVILYSMCWALTFPVSLWVARVLSDLTRIDWRFVIFQVVVCFVLVAATGASRGMVLGAFYYEQYGPLKLVDIGNYAISYAYTGFMSYVVSLMLGYTIEYHRLFRDNAVRAARLETQLVQSQLEALKAQLHPHFLFNTLNAIVTLMRKGETAAKPRYHGGPRGAAGTGAGHGEKIPRHPTDAVRRAADR